MRAPYFKLYVCIENIAVEGNVSQNFDIGPGSFSTKFRKNSFFALKNNYDLKLKSETKFPRSECY